jgi:hypothetical protein
MLRCPKLDTNAKAVLHQAGMTGDKKLVALLLGHGANVYAKNRDGNKTALQAVMRGYRYSLEDALLKTGVKMPPVLSLSQRNVATEEELFEVGLTCFPDLYI